LCSSAFVAKQRRRAFPLDSLPKHLKRISQYCHTDAEFGRETLATWSLGETIRRWQ